MDSLRDPSTPKWKRDLIQRIRNKNKWFSDSSDEQEQQLLAGNTSDVVGRTVQQPNLTCSSSSTAAVVVPVANTNVCDARMCNEGLVTMVKDRVIDCDLENNCSVDEDLHYGPGIVKKLKNHYLSLTLRECNAPVRPSILPLRKATSLENLLDDDVTTTPNNKPPSTHYSRYKPRFNENETKKFTNNRYYNASRGVDLKRARSVEAISRSDEPHTIITEEQNDTRLKHQSFHEEMLIFKEGNGVTDNNTNVTPKETKPFSNTVNHKVNRPKRITPLMSEKEKPPVDVVKQTKRIFEGKAETRTKQPYHTGDVAAKIASYKNIIQTKNHSKKPTVIKQKPVIEAKKTPTNQLNKQNGCWKSGAKKSPPDIGVIPDVSLIGSTREENNGGGSPNLSETPDLILHSSPVKQANSPVFQILDIHNFLKAEVAHSWVTKNDTPDGSTKVVNTRKATMQNIHSTRPYLPNINSSNAHTTPKITTHQEKKTDIVPQPLTHQEIQKNQINSSKTAKVIAATSPILENVENVRNMEVKKTPLVPKSSVARKPNDQNSIVFKFTDRVDVPDYVYNDGKIRTGKIEKPKIGEGGIILLPGVSLDESIIDDGDDWMLILKGPPSPCDIEFINGNILIDGRSSLNQKSKKPKMRIKFVEAVPEIFEYPSEASVALEFNRSTSPIIEGLIVNTVSTHAGTSLANYIPKLGSTEEFQLGITRTTTTFPIMSKQSETILQEELQDVEEPVLFSAGTNSDILF